jgi:hypothetical protein
MRRRFTLAGMLIFLFMRAVGQYDPAGGAIFHLKVREAYNQWGNRNTPTWIVNGTCVARDGNGWMYFDQPVGTRWGSVNSDISFSLDAWQEDSDCSNRCVWEDGCNAFGNDSDDGRAQYTHYFNLSNNSTGFPVAAPGEYYELPSEFLWGGYGVKISVSYTTPVPKKPGITVNGNSYEGGNVCSSNTVVLSPDIHVNPIYHALINYSWQYHIKGDSTLKSRWICTRYECGILRKPACKTCTPTPSQESKAAANCYCEDGYRDYYNVPNWKSLPNTNGGNNNGKLDVSLNTLEGLQNLTSNKQVFFRVSALANNSTASGYSVASNVVDVNPSAPTSDLVASLSCSATPTGKITLQNVVSAFASPAPKYLIKNDVVTDPGCDPTIPGNCLGTGNISGDISNLPNYEIPTPVASGTYTVFLFNGGGSQGFCPSVGKIVVVPSIPDLGVNSLQANSIACHGADNGSISYSISQGRPDNVSHVLTNTTTGQVWSQSSSAAGATIGFGSLTPGTYQLTTTDNCSPPVTTHNVVISQPAKVIAANLQAAAATCASPGNGTTRVDVTKSTGTETSSSFAYQLFLGGSLYNESITTNNSYTWSNLPVGNYTIMVREPGALDCNASNNVFTIDAPPALSIPGISTNPTLCYGSSDGNLSFTGSGGANAYYFEATPMSGGPTIQNTNGNFSGLPAGNYQIAIRSQLAGCNDSYAYPNPVTVNQPSPIGISLSKQNISCYGQANGSLTATPSGGTPVSPGQYSYAWEVDKGGSWVTVPAFTGTASSLQSGTYRVRVTDANNCSQPSTSEQIIEPAQLQITNVMINDIKCLGETGSLAATSSGGTGSVSYEYSSNGGVSFQPLTGTTLLSAGLYQLRGIDQNGCQASASGTYSITAPGSVLAFNHTLSNYNGFAISCFGGNNGTITISPSGGNGGGYSGYTYAIGSGSYSDNPVIGNLFAGSYQVKVKDARGCVVEKLVMLTQSSEQINPNLIEKKDVPCSNDITGILEVSAQGGLPPYQFALNNNPPQVSGRFTGLMPGTYTIRITDGNNCSTNYTDIIASGSPAIQLDNIAISDIKCAGDKGFMAVQANGGTAPLTLEYSLNGGNSYSAFTSLTPLNAGDYIIRIKDSKGCQVQVPSSYSITQPPSPLTFSATTSDYNGYGVACFGGNNGFITIAPSGGNGGSYMNYLYSVSGNPYNNEPIVSKVTAGSYSVKVRDGRQCEVEKIITLTQPDQAVSATLIDKKDVVCAGDNEGIIEINAAGGVAPYQFVLDGNLTQSDGKFSSLEAGSYTVLVKDKNQCESTIAVSVLSNNPAPQITTTINSVKCFGESNGSIDVSLAGGSPPFQYSWSGFNQTTASLGNLRAGTYILKITDNVGCVDDVELEVKQPDRLRMSVDILPTCFGQRTGEVNVEARGGVAPYQYSVTGSSSYQDTPLFTSLRAGDYTVRIKDANGCTGKDEIEVTEKNSKAEPNFLVSTKRYASDTLVATDISVPRPDSIQWTFDPRIVIVDDDKWSPQMLFTEAGKFTMSMAGFYSGCNYTITKTLSINPFDPEAVLIDEPKYKAIEEFEVYPNPSTTGNFDIDIKLSHKQYILVTVLDALGTVKQTRYWEKVKQVKDNITMANVVAGLYLVRVVTETDVRETRVMIDR